MDRKTFVKSTILGVAAAATGTSIALGEDKKQSTYDKLMQQVGYNHLPNKE